MQFWENHLWNASRQCLPLMPCDMLLLLARVNIKEEERHLLLWHKSAISLSGCITKQPGHHIDVTMQVVTQSLSAMQWDAPFSLLASSLFFSGGSRFFLWTFIRQCPVGDQSPKNRIPGMQECKCKGISWFISWGGFPGQLCRGDSPKQKKKGEADIFTLSLTKAPECPNLTWELHYDKVTSSASWRPNKFFAFLTMCLAFQRREWSRTAGVLGAIRSVHMAEWLI